jgi:hypothetical protein
MIVKGMSFKEIIEESKEDYAECMKRAAKILYSDKKIKKFIINIKKSCKLNKQPTKYFFKHFTLISKNKNTALIIPYYNTEIKEIEGYVYILYNFGSGYHAVLVEEDDYKNNYLVNRIYTPHFFDRFRERELKNDNLSKFEVISKFSKFYCLDTYLIKNVQLSSLDLPEDIQIKFQKYPKEGYIEPYTDTGLIIFERYDDIKTVVIKTYLSLDILKEDQKILLKDLISERRKVNT